MKFLAQVSLCALTVVALTPSSANAQEKGDEAPMSADTIIVSGERIDRTIFETSSSVSVTTSETLDQFAGPDTLSRIFQQTANVTDSGAGNQTPTIRGTNTSGILTSLESFFGGSQPRTTVQVDGRQLTFNEFVYSGESVWDIERVEIFRGPQTTTQGRNAISGAIFIQTANPNYDEFEGRIRGIYGTGDTRQLSGVVSGPLVGDQVAIRLSADYREQETYVIPLGVTEDIGVDIRHVETLNLRAKLGIRPEALPGLEALFTYTLADTARPQTDSVDAPFENLERFNPQFSVFETRSNAGIAKLRYDVGDGVKITNTTTYTDVGVERIVAVGAGNAVIDSDEFTNEFLISLDVDNGPSGFFGSYYSDLRSDETLDLSGFGIGSGTFSDERKSFGLFAEGSVPLAASLTATAGIRYQHDSQDRDGGFDGIIPVDFDNSFDAVLPKFELAYQASDNVRFGVSAKRGYNAGGFTFNFDTFATELFSEETLWNYEVFLRTKALNGRLTANANVFYTDFKNLQIATLVELGPNFFANVFSNVPEARSIGAELDLRFKASNTLMLQGGVGITDTKLQSNSTAGALIEGNEFERAPGITAVGGAVWEPIYGFSLSAFGRYSDGYFSDDANLAANRVGSYFVADFQASYEWQGARIFVDLTNAFDNAYPLSIFDNGAAASVGTPQQVSVGLEYSF